MNALDYFLKANLYGLLFAGCYWLFLRRHTFLTVNRAYLLLSAVLSLALPLASLPTETVETFAVPVGVIALPVSIIATAPIEPTGPDWTLLILCAYGLIALGLLLRLIIQSGRVFQLIRQSDRQPRDGYILVLPRNQTTPTFSFFQYVVLNPADVDNDLILQHELVHVRQHHSADVMGLAILRAVFWPVLALTFVEQALRHVHEFLADNQASSQPDYAQFLVEYTFGVRPGVLTNGFFNPSLLKQRILMLHQRTTNRWALGKYALVLPLAFSLLTMTTAQEEIAAAVEQAVVTQATGETITVSGKVTGRDGKPLQGAHVLITNSIRGTYTDSQGLYIMKNVPKNASLAYSFIGHRTDLLRLEGSSGEVRQGRLTLNPRLKSVPDELPAMGATAAYKAVKPNPAMPVRTPASSATINGAATTAVEEPAVFPTGVPGLMHYVAKNLRYPAKARAAGIEGDVYVLFTILPTGAVSGAKVNRNIQGVGGGCEAEAVRVVSQMPLWLPARQQGKPVAMRYMLPIRFALEKKEDKRTGQVNQEYEPVFKPTGSPVGDFPTTRAKDFLNQPRLNTVFVKTPATIRGRGPLGQLEGPPLYIIDGREISADSVKVDSKDIESMTVLKDASATDQYGEKGKNGVVIITTKKP